MNDHTSSLYESIDGSELDAVRSVQFGDRFYEHDDGGPRQGESWKVRHCLPTNAQAYCAFILPWHAYLDGTSGWRSVRDVPFESIAEAYEYLGMPIPHPLTLDSWKTDFKMLETTRELPPLARFVLDRFSRNADAIFVRCHHVEVHNWRIDRALFHELPDPFLEMPQPFGTFGIFPRGASWYLHHRDDEPMVYLAGSSALVAELEQACPGRVVHLTLEDRYY